MRIRHPAFLCALGGSLALSCVPALEGPSWTSLARDAAQPILGAPATTQGAGYRIRNADEGRRIEVVIPRDSWREFAPGKWETHQPVLSIGRPPEGVPAYRLTFPDEPGFLPALDADGKFSGEGDRFAVLEGKVRLRADREDLPPGDGILSVYAVAQEHRDDGRWIVSGRRVGGEGFALEPGASVSVTCDVPPESALSFGFAVEAMLLGKKVRLAKHTLRVWLENSVLAEREFGGGFESVEWIRLPFPRGGGKRVEVRFELEGPPTYAAVLDPRIVPSEVGSYGERPFAQERRDVVFFQADTFRADNLEAYGGTDGRAPNLDRLAEQSLVFRHAHSVATHTLPTHTTFFSGRYPRQNGLVTLHSPLPEQVDTLAEYLERSGFRTVAITDGVMVSQAQGMAQGFGWFDERRTDLDGTVQRVRAALEADDGRPLFLFIQTYASHAPYTIREETREQLGEQWSSEGSFNQWFSRIQKDPEDSNRVLVEAAGAREAIAEISKLYAAAVHDLDRGFGEIRALLEASGILREGTLLVTSDHGESFGEHDWLFHTGVPHGELIDVPLMLSAADIEPGVDAAPVSLIDIAPTIAERAGVPPLPTWVGGSLLAQRTPSPLFAFQCRGTSTRSTLAVLDDRHKLIGFEDLASHTVSRWTEAYDLQGDPAELENLLGTATWPERLQVQVRDRLQAALTPLVESEETQFNADQLRTLDAMGYGGEQRE